MLVPLICALFVLTTHCSGQYLYPVAHFDQEHGKQLLLLHQKSPEHIDLLGYDLATGQIYSVLFSLYNPVGVRLMPDGLGFSFLDSGRLRIKAWHKRGVKTVDLYEPLYNIGLVCWGPTDGTCYFSAQERNRFSIYQVNEAGDLLKLVGDGVHDYLYPAYCGTTLFFICRSYSAGVAQYAIMCRNTQPSSDSYELLVNFQDRPIVFLTLFDDTRGMVLEHATQIDSDDEFLELRCHQLYRDQAGWKTSLVCVFHIPLTYLLSNSPVRLCESILPFIPRYVDGSLLYVDYATHYQRTTATAYQYIFSTQETRVIHQVHDALLTVPFPVAGRLLCGGMVSEEVSDSCPFLSFNASQRMCAQFPCVNIGQ